MGWENAAVAHRSCLIFFAATIRISYRLNLLFSTFSATVIGVRFLQESVAMSRSVFFLVAGWVLVSSAPLVAQDAVLGQIYGNGVHAYFGQNYELIQPYVKGYVLNAMGFAWLKKVRNTWNRAVRCERFT